MDKSTQVRRVPTSKAKIDEKILAEIRREARAEFMEEREAFFLQYTEWQKQIQNFFQILEEIGKVIQREIENIKKNQDHFVDASEKVYSKTDKNQNDSTISEISHEGSPEGPAAARKNELAYSSSNTSEGRGCF